MAICKCKMCGGDLNITELDKIVTCEYCGTTQTVPSADNEKKMTLFNRANRLRMNSEFDKAAGIYENIIAEFPEEAEAYWGALLCKYGIEYVDDPATGEKKPTCHRASFEKAARDEYFELAMEYADVTAQKVYRDEAREIDRINEEILSISRNEQPYDIFICYKETDESGNRTPDSVMAQDIYDALTGKGYKVFFSRITLEDKLGLQYEPYIFAALNSAKIMLCVGTKYEYFHAVWVKNEWSRFLRLAAKDKSKVLIPCYRDMDPYDMPDEFRMLQAQDLGKLGAMQDLTRGIAKILGDSPAPVPAAPVAAPAATPVVAPTENLLNRAYLFLEDGDWTNADAYAEKVLDLDFENAEAYLVKALSSMRLRTREALADREGFDSDSNIAKAQRFGSAALQEELAGYQEAARLAAEARRKEEEDRRKAEEAQRKAEEECRQAEAERRRAEELQKQKEMERRFREKIEKTVRDYQGRISAGIYHTVCAQATGHALAVGSNEFGQCDLSAWKDIISISAGYFHTVGLRIDGTVVAEGGNGSGQSNVTGPAWSDIVAVSAGKFHTVALRRDGTVLAVGSKTNGKCDVKNWKGLVAIDAGGEHTVGVCADGTVVAVGSNKQGQCNVSRWSGIVSVAAGETFTLGLQADGTVVCVGEFQNKNSVALWQNVIAISANGMNAVALTMEGKAYTVGGNGYHQRDLDTWDRLIGVSAGYMHVIGLREDGTVLSAGDNRFGQLNVEGWQVFDPSSASVTQEYLSALQQELQTLKNELPSLGGVFKASRRKEAEARINKIEIILRHFSSSAPTDF